MREKSRISILSINLFVIKRKIFKFSLRIFFEIYTLMLKNNFYKEHATNEILKN
jgi:hypothetical protein